MQLVMFAAPHHLPCQTFVQALWASVMILALPLALVGFDNRLLAVWPDFFSKQSVRHFFHFIAQIVFAL
jgi:hypothetical protein